MEGPFTIYSRKSRFTGKGESIENQIEMCRQYIRAQFGREAADAALVYEDEGFSGGTLERPQFKKMMADAETMRFRAIVVYRLDRISRNIGDFAGLIERLNGMKIGFISIREQFDTTSPMGRAMMYISSVFSQLERETIAERIRDNMRELAKTGRWLGGVPPTGFESESVSSAAADGKVRRACRLRAIPGELDVVRLIFHKFLETGSLARTEDYLLQNGYATKNGKPFTRFALKGILGNPVYLTADEAAYAYFRARAVDLFSGADAFDGTHGIMAYNRTLQQPGKANKLRPMEEWIVAVGRHPGTVDGMTWTKAQALLEGNRSRTYRKPRSQRALLSGLLVCGGCGGYMRPKQSRRLNAQGEEVYTYLCAAKERSRGQACRMKNCAGNLLDAGVVESLKSLREDRGEFLRRLEGAAGDSPRETARLQAGLRENEEEIRGLVRALSRAEGASAEAYILERLEELHRRDEALRRQLEELAESADPGALASFGELVGEMTVEQKRWAIRAVVERVIWDGETARVVLAGAGPAASEPSGEDSK